VQERKVFCDGRVRRARASAENGSDGANKKTRRVRAGEAIGNWAGSGGFVMPAIASIVWRRRLRAFVETVLILVTEGSETREQVTDESDEGDVGAKDKNRDFHDVLIDRSAGNLSRIGRNNQTSSSSSSSRATNGFSCCAASSKARTSVSASSGKRS